MFMKLTNLNSIRTSLKALFEQKANNKKSYARLKELSEGLRPQLKEANTVPLHAKGFTWRTKFGNAATLSKSVIYRLRQDERLVISVNPSAPDTFSSRHQQNTYETKGWQDIAFSRLNDKAVKLQDLTQLIEDYTGKIKDHHGGNRFKNYFRKARQVAIATTISGLVLYATNPEFFEGTQDTNSAPPVTHNNIPQAEKIEPESIFPDENSQVKHPPALEEHYPG
jgi:hypothetical protein